MKREAGATTLEAKRIAEARLRKEESRQFLNQPTFLQAGLWYFSKYANVRAQSFHQIYFAADLLKDLGNAYYKQQNIDQAIEAYQEALSVFRFVKPSKEALKKEELTDADLEYVQYAGTNEKENFLLTHIQHVLYLNLSIGYIRTKQFQNAISACTFDLELDGSSVKSLYRRALARYSMQSKQRWDQDVKLAVADLKRALDIDPLDEDIKELLCQIQENNNFQAKPLEKSVPIIPAPSITETKKEEETNKKATQQLGYQPSQKMEVTDKVTEGPQPTKEQNHLDNSNEKSVPQQSSEKPKLSDFADYKEYMLHTNPQYAEYYKRQQQFAEKHKQNSSKQSMDVSFESTKTGKSIDFKNKKQHFKYDSDDGTVNRQLETNSKILPKNPSEIKENIQSERSLNQSQKQNKLPVETSSQSKLTQQKYLEEQIQNQKQHQQQQPSQQQQQQQLPQTNQSQLKYQQYFQPSQTGTIQDQIPKGEPLSKKKEKKKNSEQARQLREIEEEKERQRIHAEEVERQKRRLIELQEQRIREEKQRQELLEVERARAALRMKVPETKANLKKGIKKNNRTTLADQKQLAQQQQQQMISRQQQQLDEQQRHMSDNNKNSTEESQDDEKIVEMSKNDAKKIKNSQTQQEYIQSFSKNQNHNNNIAKKPLLKGKQAFEEDDLLDTKASERLKLLKRNINNKNGQEGFSDDNEETNGYANRDPFADLPPYIPPNPAVSQGQLDLCEGSSILKQRESDKIFQHSYKSDYQDYLDQKHILDSDEEIPEIPGLVPPSYKSYAQKRRETLLNENTKQTKKQMGKYQKILLWSAIIIFIIALWWASGEDNDVPAGTVINSDAPLESLNEFQPDEGLVDEFDLLLED